MRKHAKPVPFLLALAVMVGLACGPCNLLSGQLPDPPRTVVISTEEAGQLASRLEQSLSGPAEQSFMLTMTDSEVTSLLATELAKYGDAPVLDPVIWFSGGKIHGTGQLVNVLPVDTPVYLVASARVVDGGVQVDVEELSAGRLPVPDSVLDLVSQSINETVDEMQLGVEVTGLEILEGEAVVKGVRLGP